MDQEPSRTTDGGTVWIDRLTRFVQAAHDGLVDLALDATADADLGCTLGAVDLRDVLDELRRHDSEMPTRDPVWRPIIELARSPSRNVSVVGSVLLDALGLTNTTAHDDVDLSPDELLLLARVAHGLARVLDRLGISRP